MSNAERQFRNRQRACPHKVLRYISHKRGSQDGVVCEKCRAFWQRTRNQWPSFGSALVRSRIKFKESGR